MANRFKYGDRVRFLNETGGGTVNRIDEKGFVYVLTEDGFEIPVQEKELVFTRNFAFTEREDEPQTNPRVNTTIQPQQKEKPVKLPLIPENIPRNTKIHILLGFIPENPGPVFNNNIGCYLINDSPLFLYYLTGKKEGGTMYYLRSGFIEADTKAFIETFDQTSISKISDIHIQLLFISKGRYVKQDPVDILVNLNQINFSKESYYRENDYFEEKSVLFNLSGTEHVEPQDIFTIPEGIREIKNEADSIQSPQAKKKESPQQDTLEVDLHYDGEGSQLSPSAILALQMSRFHSAIEEAISKNLRRLVVIHGLGQGTLKMQIRKELQEKYPKFLYQDASFREYGFGATMVHIVIDHKQ